MPDEPISEDEVMAEMVEALRDAGVHPAHVDAFVQCGFVVTEMNMHLMTAEQIDQWEDAINLWIAAHPDEEPPQAASGGPVDS